MRNAARIDWALVVVAILANACTDSKTQSNPTCVPGTTLECYGPGACLGVQICNQLGSGYGVCDCAVTAGTGGTTGVGGANAVGRGGSNPAAGGHAIDPSAGGTPDPGMGGNVAVGGAPNGIRGGSDDRAGMSGAGSEGRGGTSGGGGGGASGRGCASMEVTQPYACSFGIPCPCGGSGTVSCGDGTCPYLTTCESGCRCPSGYFYVSCTTGKICNGDCEGGNWGCQKVDPNESEPGCTGNLSKVSGTCRCMDGRSLRVECGTSGTCDQLCLGQAPQGTSSDAGTPQTGRGAPVGSTCAKNGTLVCGTSETCNERELVLSCENNVYRRVWQCPQTQTCQDILGNSSIRCGISNWSISYAVQGTPCAAEQAAACSFDQTEVLNCQRGVWELSRNCGTGVARCEHFDPGEGSCPVTSESGCIGCD